MKKAVEVIHGDKSLRLNLYIAIATYLLIIILIEPSIDFILLYLFKQNALAAIEQVNQIKIIVSTLIYVLLALIPAVFFSWYGYRIIASSKLPPIVSLGNAKFPFTVNVIKGKHAKMFGVLIVVVSLVLIFQLILYLAKVLFL